MAWILLEGVDRSGKSTVAKWYEKQGYAVVHLTAPDKKYSDPNYAGPSYFEEMYELYAKYDGQDILWDRTIYGEAVWPYIYGRKPQLTEEEIQDLRDLEGRNDPTYIFMTDKDVKSHWERCEADDEPLNKEHFKAAIVLYRKLADQYAFMPMELPVFLERHKVDGESLDKVQTTATTPANDVDASGDQAHPASSKVLSGASTSQSAEQRRLEEANAINTVLTSKLIKKKGVIFEKIEHDVKGFLQDRLRDLLGQPSSTFSDDEKKILKTYCKLIKEKETKRS